jgi:hypothetical protein
MGHLYGCLLGWCFVRVLHTARTTLRSASYWRKVRVAKVNHHAFYRLEWRFFARLDSVSKYFMEEPAHALAIPGELLYCKDNLANLASCVTFENPDSRG